MTYQGNVVSDELEFEPGVTGAQIADAVAELVDILNRENGSIINYDHQGGGIVMVTHKLQGFSFKIHIGSIDNETSEQFPDVLDDSARYDTITVAADVRVDGDDFSHRGFIFTSVPTFAGMLKESVTSRYPQHVRRTRAAS